MNRLMIYAHNHPHGDLPSHVLFLLERMLPLFEKVIFASLSKLNEKDIKELLPFSHRIIIREDCCSGFGLWKEVINGEGQDYLKSCDYLTLMNDSCFGPIFDPLPFFEQMEANGIDFWGLTECRSSENNGYGHQKRVNNYVQSHLISFRKKVILSEAFTGFWENLDIGPDKHETVSEFESGLTQSLVKSGFHYNVLLKANLHAHQYHEDFSELHPDILIRQGLPFVKINAFLQFPHPKYLKKLLQRSTAFPVQLIDDHISRTYNPNISIKALDKNLVPNPCMTVPKCTASIAVHLHAYYVDVFDNILRRLGRTGLVFDLFITTDSQAKKEQILEIIHNQHHQKNLKEIRIYENRGRDLLPWFDIAEKMADYEIAGHFHTKKSNWTDEWIGDSWMEDIFSTLIDPAGEIMELFCGHPEIGIVIPDIPYAHKLIPELDTWSRNKTNFHKIWKSLYFEKALNIQELYFPVMPYGNMFWYRPESLKPLLNMHLTAQDFPPEPLPFDDTIAHAIERLPVYIAWGQGYDFRVVLNDQLAYSGFDYQIGNERLNQVYQSLTWQFCHNFGHISDKILSRLKLI